MRRRAAWTAFLLATICCCDSRPASENRQSTTRTPQASTAPANAKPNILLYMVDTLRADSLGCYGNQVVDTPAIDRFANQGVLFQSAIAPSSWTRASIASVLTSLDPAAHGAQGRRDLLSDDLVLLSERLQAHGYRTACITANPNIGACFGFNQGFDDFIELYARRNAGEVDALELVTSSSVVTSRAIDWIDQARQPFFMMILTIDPHSPYVPPARFDRYGEDYAGQADGTRRCINRPDLSRADQKRIRSLYYGEVAFNDDSFGRLLDHLHDAKLADRTIVAFTSDHGEEFWEHGQRGHGKTLFEESIHVPLILRYPGVAAGTRVARTIQLVDIFPTFLQLAGLPIPEDLDGRSLPGNRTEEEIAFASLFHDGRRLLAVRANPWKMIWDLNSRKRLLFELTRSPNELANEITAHPQQRARLFAHITERMRRNAARFAAIHSAGTPGQTSEDQLPQDVLKTLKALGYLGDE
jgi:arylsulfatase A-like enzyme